MGDQAGGVVLSRDALIRWLEIRLAELRSLMKPGESMRIDLPGSKRFGKLVAVVHVERGEVSFREKIGGDHAAV